MEQRQGIECDILEKGGMDLPDEVLAEAGIAPDPTDLRAEYDAIVGRVLAEGTLAIPGGSYVHKGGRTGRMHTEHLGHLLTSMQWLQRAYPGQQW